MEIKPLTRARYEVLDNTTKPFYSAIHLPQLFSDAIIWLITGKLYGYIFADTNYDNANPFKYIYRRFGHPNSGTDDYKCLAEYRLDIGRDDVILNVYFDSSLIKINLLVSKEINRKLHKEIQSRRAEPLNQVANQDGVLLYVLEQFSEFSAYEPIDEKKLRIRKDMYDTIEKEYNETAIELGFHTNTKTKKEKEEIIQTLNDKKEKQIEFYREKAKGLGHNINAYYWDYLQESVGEYEEIEYKGKLLPNALVANLLFIDSWEEGTTHHDLFTIYKQVIEDFMKPTYVRDCYFNLFGEMDSKYFENEENESHGFDSSGALGIYNEMLENESDYLNLMESIFTLGGNDLKEGMKKALEIINKK